MPRSVIGASDQGPGLHMPEAHGQTPLFQHPELVRMHVPVHGQMRAGRLQVLPEGQDVAIDRPEITHCLEDFVGGLPQSQHHAAFGDHPPPFRPVQQLKRPRVFGLRPHRRVQAGDRLRVVIQNVRMRINHRSKRLQIPSEIRDQHFHREPGAERPGPLDGSREY